MNYLQTIEYLFNNTPVFEQIGNAAYKEGLAVTHALDAHFNHPHRTYRTIHVGGTNGKGSCSHTLAAILQQQGYKVGLYTSPHLLDFKERIKVDGACIEEQYVIDFVARERNFFEPLHPSFFELTTAMAFKYFADCAVDIAVIEVGLGGRLDCTNIISPLLSVITNISLDHTALLGNTLAKIAGEKAGIIKPDTPVVIGEDNAETRPVFLAKAQEMNAPIRFAGDTPLVLSADMEPSGGIRYRTHDLGTFHGQLAGNYQIKNTNTLLHALEVLQQRGITIDAASIRYGFAHVTDSTSLAGRWQTLHTEPLVICDIGHNTAAWGYLSHRLEALPCRRLLIVFGMVDDKDIAAVVQLLPHNARYFFTKAQCKRALPEQQVALHASSANLQFTTYPTVSDALHAALSQALAGDAVFIGGSNYIVSEALPIVNQFFSASPLP